MFIHHHSMLTFTFVPCIIHLLSVLLIYIILFPFGWDCAMPFVFCQLYTNVLLYFFFNICEGHLDPSASKPSLSQKRWPKELDGLDIDFDTEWLLTALNCLFCVVNHYFQPR